jgi:hypothetical protein
LYYTCWLVGLVGLVDSVVVVGVIEVAVKELLGSFDSFEEVPLHQV